MRFGNARERKAHATFVNLSEMSESIFIVSGGTGGHIIPARCLADYLSSQNRQVFFFGDERIGIYCKQEGRQGDLFQSRIIKASQFKKTPGFLLKICLGFCQSLYFLLKFRPRFLVAFGGYATFPMLVAALVTHTKIILHEQNAHLGKVNRLFARFAYKIVTSFPQTSGIASQDLTKITFAGNPIRPEIARLHELSYDLPKHQEETPLPNNRMGYDVLLNSDFYQEEPKQNFFKILVIGGSGGARIFSETLPKAFFNLSEIVKERIQVIQQCRAELVATTFEQYKSFNISVVIDSFFEDMPDLLRDVHLVIARSGSSSIAEFCAAKKPMILIPFAAAADNHQEKNAHYLESHGAAIVLRETDFTISKINELLKDLIENEVKLKKLSDNAGKLAVLDATQNLAGVLK